MSATAVQVRRLAESGLGVEEIGELLRMSTNAVRGALEVSSAKKKEIQEIGDIFSAVDVKAAAEQVNEILSAAEKDETRLAAAKLIIDTHQKGRQQETVPLSQINEAIKTGIELARLHHELGNTRTIEANVEESLGDQSGHSDHEGLVEAEGPPREKRESAGGQTGQGELEGKAQSSNKAA